MSAWCVEHGAWSMVRGAWTIGHGAAHYLLCSVSQTESLHGLLRRRHPPVLHLLEGAVTQRFCHEKPDVSKM